MKRLVSVRVVVISAAVLTLWSTAAIAQSRIAGQVRDNTGAVLPGTTVEAASPALIEGSRTVVTDGQGRYEIIELRPGVYAVTFTLAGFNKMVQDALTLPANFTATVDATLSIGTLEESIVISGAAPLVDVKQTQTNHVLTRETLDAVVNSGNRWSQALLMPGVRASGVDVGGSNNANDLQLEAHGANGRHTTVTIDGIVSNGLITDGAQHLYYQDRMNDEVSVQTSGGTAEQSAGGVRFNMIPKNGGNTFRGSAYIGRSSGAWQSDNFSQKLKDAGLTSTAKLDQEFDYSLEEGGPLVQNRLWFFATGRFWGINNPVANTLFDDGSQYVAQNNIRSAIVRLTAQVTRSNKFTLHLDRQGKFRGPKTTAKYPAVLIPGQLGDDPETSALWQDWSPPMGMAQLKWTSTPSSKVLIELGHDSTVHTTQTLPLPGVDAPIGSSEWFIRTPKTDLDLGQNWNGRTGTWARWWRHTTVASASYVTGTHNVKVGTQWSRGTSRGTNFSNGDIASVRYRSGVPDSVTVGNYPVWTRVRLNRDLGVYGQDQWTIGRLTVRAGVRFEWLNSGVDAQSAGAGRFVPAREFAPVKNVADWFNTSPRIGLAYDLFGTGRTALKFSWGRYYRPQTTSLATSVNPLAVTTVAIPWNDRDLRGTLLATNNDGIAQNNEIDLTRLPTNFGTRQLDTIDPNLEREFNNETAVNVVHQITRRLAVGGGWYHRRFGNQQMVDNLERDFNDYVPVQIVSPYDGEVITAYTLRNAAELSLVNNLQTTSHKRKEIYNGFEFYSEANFGSGAKLMAGYNQQRTITDTCDQPDNPNLLRFCDRANLPAPYKLDYKGDFRISGVYPLPGRVMVSGRYTNAPGRLLGDFLAVDEMLPITWNISRTTRYSASDCASGRPCTAGALVIPNLVETSLVVPLAPAGTVRRLPRNKMLDLGVRTKFRVGQMEVEPQFDLYNALNASDVLEELSANFGTPAFGVPSNNVNGRMPRVALQLSW